MADEQTATTTEPAEQTSTETQQPSSEEQTFTQADVDRILAERLARERRAAEEKTKAEAEKAKLATEERLKLEREEAEEARTAAEEKARVAGWRADLKGEVRDVNAALKLIDPEKHLDADGNVNLRALLKDYDFLAPVSRTAPGGGGPQDKTATDPRSSLTAAMAADGIKF